MQPLVMIAFDQYGNTTVEEEIFGKVGAKIKFTKTILTREAKEIAKKADAIGFTTEPITREAIETFSNCKILSRYGTGLDNVDIRAATGRGLQRFQAYPVQTRVVGTRCPVPGSSPSRSEPLRRDRALRQVILVR